MKLPSKLAIAAGTLIAGGAGITQELDISRPLHKAILLAAGAALFLLNPQAPAAGQEPQIPASVTAQAPPTL